MLNNKKKDAYNKRPLFCLNGQTNESAPTELDFFIFFYHAFKRGNSFVKSADFVY